MCSCSPAQYRAPVKALHVVPRQQPRCGVKGPEVDHLDGMLEAAPACGSAVTGPPVIGQPEEVVPPAVAVPKGMLAPDVPFE
jgi:hypothetical protein